MIHALAGLMLLADCSPGSRTIWPPAGTEVPENARFVVEEYGTERGKATPEISGVKLSTVPLRGSHNVDQLVLIPDVPLAPGETQISAGRQTVTVKVRRGRDTTAPRWTEAPQAGKSELQHFGCGPSAYQFFQVAVEDDSPVRIRVRVESLRTGEAGESLLAITNGAVRAGHGMCSGAFEMKEGEAYRATFTAVDVAGNESPAPGRPIDFTAPQSRHRGR